MSYTEQIEAAQEGMRELKTARQLRNEDKNLRMSAPYNANGHMHSTTEKMPTNPKTLQGVKKPPMDQLPPIALMHMAVAMFDGATKYGFRNWRKDPVEARIYVAAAMRHLAAFLDGEFWDPRSKSQASHLGEAMAGIGVLLDAMQEGNWIDDRRPGEGARAIRHFEDHGVLPEPKQPVEFR